MNWGLFLCGSQRHVGPEAGGLSALLANTVYIDAWALLALKSGCGRPALCLRYRDDACSDSDSTVPSEEAHEPTIYNMCCFATNPVQCRWQETALLPPTAVAPRVAGFVLWIPVGTTWA